MQPLDVFWQYLMHRIDVINNVTSYEYILLATTFEIANYKDRSFDCFHCINKLKKKTRNIQIARFCEDVSKTRVNFIQDRDTNIEFFKCVGNFNNSVCMYYISLYYSFKEGKLPEPGGLYDQPAKVVDIFNILYSMEGRIQEEKTKSAQAQNSTRM